MSTAQGHTRTNKLSHTGQFREAGLHEWMPFVISRARVTKGHSCIDATSTAQGHPRTIKLSHTGQFREAGLHEWMPFVISRARVTKGHSCIDATSTAQGHPRTIKLSHTGQFKEAGLHEWMPFVISRTRSHERSQLPLPGWVLSRPWFMLCITWNLNLQPWSSTNATAVAFARLTGERWWRKCKKKKSVCIGSWMTRRSSVCGKNAFFCIQ